MTPVAWASDDDEETLTGALEVGYRGVEVNGSEGKYREDVNLSEGFRLFDLRLDWAPRESGLADRLTVDASHLGGDPFQTARFSVEKVGKYDLDLRYRSTEFFYADRGWYFNPEGDLHRWDARRDFFGVGLEIDASRNVRVRLGADRQDRDGASTTTRNLQRDVFVLERPVNQTASTYWAAADFRAGWADITVEGRLLSYENDWQQTASDTGGQDGLSFLQSYRQDSTEKADVPVGRVVFSGRPLRFFRFSVGYVRAATELDHDTTGAWSGTDFDGLTFDTTLTNSGTVERTTDRADLDLSFAILANLALHADYSHLAYDQDGFLDSEEVQTGGTDAGSYFVQGNVLNEIRLDRYGVTLDWRATRSFSLAVGVGRQERTKDFQLSGLPVTTERSLYRGAVRWRPGRLFDLRVDYSQGEDENPVTPISPTTGDRLKVQAVTRPAGALALSLTYRDETHENELGYPLGRPTTDTPPATRISLAEFGVEAWAFELIWSGRRLNAVAGYSSTRVLADADIVYNTGFTTVPTFQVFSTLQTTGYLSERNVFFGDVRYEVGRGWLVGADASVADSSGSFPVQSNVYGAEVRYRFYRGLFARFKYRRFDYAEDNPYAVTADPADPTQVIPAPGINDYDADLWTASLGYGF
jgi:hypothetical protein